MTRKHFIELAEALIEVRRRIEHSSDDTNVSKDAAFEIVVAEITRFARSQNGRFDADRFRNYINTK